jgi:AraC-like DNA-binding protein
MARLPCDRFVPSADAAATWERWIEHISPIFAPSARPETSLASPIAMRSYNLGSILVGDLSAPAQNLGRSPRMIAQQGVDHLLIQICRSGTGRIDTGRTTVEIGEADCAIYDLAQPVAIAASSITATTIVVPRGLLAGRDRSVAALHGTVLRTRDSPAAKLFASYLCELVSVADRLDAKDVPGVAAAAAKLCRAAIPDPPADPHLAERRVSTEIRAFIQSRLASPDLGAEMICARFGLSRATLYRQLATEGGIHAYIRNRRLARAMQLLTCAPDGARPRVSAVAYRSGFADERTFSRAFKRHYGVSPRSVADEGLAGWRGGGGTTTLDTWIRQLDA